MCGMLSRSAFSRRMKSSDVINSSTARPTTSSPKRSRTRCRTFLELWTTNTFVNAKSFDGCESSCAHVNGSLPRSTLCAEMALARPQCFWHRRGTLAFQYPWPPLGRKQLRFSMILRECPLLLLMGRYQKGRNMHGSMKSATDFLRNKEDSVRKSPQRAHLNATRKASHERHPSNVHGSPQSESSTVRNQAIRALCAHRNFPKHQSYQVWRKSRRR